ATTRYARYVFVRYTAPHSTSFPFPYQSHSHPRDLHSFPTRRSSDLAAIPAQDRIIVVGWLNFLRLFKIAHRFFKQPHKNMRGTPGSHLGFGAALMKQAQVVVPLVGIGEPAERAFRFAKTVP